MCKINERASLYTWRTVVLTGASEAVRWISEPRSAGAKAEPDELVGKELEDDDDEEPDGRTPTDAGQDTVYL